MSMTQPSFWDVEDVDALPPVRDMDVRCVSFKDVTEFCLRYHYSQTGGNGYWPWGLWHGQTLFGVVAYGLPSLSVVESVFGPEHSDHVWHMAKLAMAEHAPHNSESRLIGGSLRQITKTRPDVWAVVTYAATDAGHLGYVYQATNAIYTGEGGHAAYYIDSDGKRRASGQMDGKTVTKEWAEARGWVRHQGGTKHRYIYILGNRTQRRERLGRLKYPSLPYPKVLPIEGATA